MKKPLLFAKLFSILILFLAYSTLSSQSTYFWTNAGADNLWSNSANWDRDGLGSDGSIPNQDAGDYVVFDNGYTTANCTIDQNTNNGLNKLIDFTVNAGYTGTITLNATFTLETTGNFDLNDGVFTGSGSSVIIGGNMTVAGGTFNQSNASLSVTGTFTCSSGTFNNATSANSTFNSTATISGGAFNKTNTGSIIFNGQFNLSSGSYNIITTTSGQTTFENNFNQTGGTFSCAIAATTRMRVSSGTFSISFTSSAGTFTHSSGTFQFITNTGSVPAAGTITINNTPSFNAVTIGNTTSTCALTVAISSSISVSGLLTITNGSSSTGTRSITINTGTINASGNLTVGGPANSTSGDGTGTINLSGCTSITAPATEGLTPLCNVTFSGATRTIALGAAGQFLTIGTSSSAKTLTISGSGDLTFNTGTISAFGDVPVTNTGTGGGGTTTLKLTGTATQTLTGSGTAGQGRLPNITIDKSSGTLNLSSVISMAGTSFTHTAGTLSAGTSTIAFYGNATISGAGTTNFNNVTIASGVTLTGKSSANINVSGAWVNSGTAYTHNSGTVTFNGASASVSGSTTTAFNHLIISSGVLTGSSGTMQVAGDWTNSVGAAGFVHNSGTVEFNGSAAQTITGATTFRNLTINNSKAATPWVALASAVELTGVLDVQDGALTTAGLLTLNSDGSGTAAIGDLSDGTPESTPISGDVIVERYINEAYTSAKYYYLASPLTDADFEDWNQEFYMSGFTGTDAPSNSFKSVITRNEAAETWPNPSNTTDIIANGTGYLCYIGNDGVGTNMPKTLNLTGTISYGDGAGNRSGTLQKSGLTNTNNETSGTNRDGWHLLGNPYPSPINWTNVNGNAGTANVNGTAKTRHQNGTDFIDLVAGVGTPLIASGEAFWVFAEDALPDGTVEFDENDKNPTGTDAYNNKHSNPLNSFKITLKDGIYSSAPTQIFFTNSHLNKPVSRNYDPYLDAGKMINLYNKENIATLLENGEKLSVNFLPDSIDQISIPVKFWRPTPANTVKTYTLQFSDVLPLVNQNKCFIFEDTEAGISFPITSDTSYLVTMSDTTSVPRFFIHVSSPITSSVTNIGCNGSASGFITATGSGSGPFNYVWKNQAGDTIRNVTSFTTDTLSGLVAGLYYLTVSNNGACGTVSDHFEIIEPSPIVLSLNKTDVACYGDSSGSATVTASGGASDFSYLWSNGSMQAQASNLTSQTYYVTVTDAGNCFSVDSVTISQPSEITVNPAYTSLACYGDSNGTATAFTSGGTSPYSYLWSTGGTNSQISNLPSQTYYITVTDNNTCSKVDSVSVSQPDALALAISSVDVACNGESTGQASLSVSGGIPGYTYSWSSGGSSAAETGLPAGVYTVTVTDANNCVKTNSVTINQPAPLSLASSSTDVMCNGDNDGSASVSVSGGTTGYTYAWSSGGTLASENAIAAGTYTVTVTDNNNCTASASFTISQPDPVSLNTSSTDVLCNGENEGQASVTATGGVSSYTYLWSSGGAGSSETGLAAGPYSVTVTDGNNCSASASVTITEPSAITISSTSADATCGSSNGSASVSASGGTGNLAYLWSNGATTASINGLQAGTYSVTVTDENSCSSSSAIIVNNISGPSINLASSADVSCNGGNDGSASLNVSGGTSPYSYSWDNGATTASVSGLSAGGYFVSVTDNNNCVGILSVSIGEPTTLALSLSAEDISCNGLNDGSASVSGSGGTSGYSYLWSNGTSTSSAPGLSAGTYTVTVSDANNCTATSAIDVNEPSVLATSTSATAVSCNGGSDGQAELSASGGVSPYSYLWNTGDNTASVSGLPAGNYTVTVTDGNNCTASANVSISQPSALALSTGSADVSCNGANDGSIELTVNGGTSPFTYLWSNGSVQAQLSGLSPQSYSVTVTDNNNCSAVTTITIAEPPAFVATTTASDASCGNSDGSVSLSATGGTGNLSYLWNNNSVTQDIQALSAGLYTVTITDENGCTISVSVTVNNIDGPATGISASDVTCNGGNNGSASATVTGGTSPYSYLWDNGETVQTIDSLAAGIYIVSVTDDLGCMSISSIIIDEPAVIVITGTTADAACGNSNGSASVTVNGGIGSFAYLWSTGDTAASLNNIAAGNYSVTATNQNGCSEFLALVVNDIGGPVISVLSSTGASCYGGSNGQIVTNSTGGASPYTYAWSTGSASASISGLTAGTYTLTVTDANNCSGVISTDVDEPAEIVITSNVTDVLCGNANGSATLSVTGGTGSYSYSWSNGQSTPSVSGLGAGNYYVLVTDANGCTKMATVTVSDIDGPSVNASVVNEPSCFGLSDGKASAAATGNAPFTFLWQDSSGDTLQFSTNITTSDVLNDIPANSYIILVADNNGCENETSFMVNQPDEVIAAFSVSSDTVDIASGGTVSLTNSSSGATGYLWNFGDGSASTQFEPSHSYTATGTFTITLNASQGQCGDSLQQTVKVINSVGIDENTFSPGLIIYQAGNTAFVECNFPRPTKVEIGLFNILGQNVLESKPILLQSGKFAIEIPEATGVYFLKAKWEGKEQVGKIFH